MEIYRIAFIGHREICNGFALVDELEKIIRDLLSKKEYVEFSVGRNGDFDIFAAAAVKRAQKAFGNHNSSLILLQPYKTKDDEYYENYYDEVRYPIGARIHPKAAITKRNEWMIEHADLLIGYVEKNRMGGACSAFKFAEKKGIPIVNLAKI